LTDTRNLEMSDNDWVFWLNLMNIALGVFVLVPFLVIVFGVLWELMLKLTKAHDRTA